jgi:hypothetical protein
VTYFYSTLSPFSIEINIFLPVNVKLGWLNNVSCVYSVVFSLLLFGQHGLAFFRPPALAPHWLEDFADGTPTKKKTYY